MLHAFKSAAKSKPTREVLIYFAISLVILGPLLRPGYILTLDMVFVPHPPWPTDFTQNTWLLEALMHLLTLVIDSDILQKLILLTIFTLAGLGMHRLVPSRSLWAKYAAGLFYVINPFTYSRLMAGQWLVLAGYALMPWFLRALLRFIHKPTRATVIAPACWLLAICLVSLHAIGFAALITAMAVLTAATIRRERLKLKRILGWGTLAAAAVLLVNSFWLAPFLAHSSGPSKEVATFDSRDLLSFRTDSDARLGQVLNTVGLYGFWGDHEGLYILPKTVLGVLWPVSLVVIVGIVIIGVRAGWRAHPFETRLLLASAFIALILAQGIMGSPAAPLNSWLFLHLAILRGYREPGKFIAIVALAEAYFLGLGAGWAIEKSKVPASQILPGLLVAFPLIYTPTMVWAAASQLQTVNYPAPWDQEASRLAKVPKTAKVLFLPWHQYMYMDFAGRLIANPATQFFGPNVIQDTATEIGLIERPATDPTATTVEQVLSGNHQDASAKLTKIGVKQIILAKVADYKGYGWLDSAAGIKPIADSATMKIYKVSLAP